MLNFTEITEIELLEGRKPSCDVKVCHKLTAFQSVLDYHWNIFIYRTIQNFGGRKFWRIWRIATELPKFSLALFVLSGQHRNVPQSF